MSEFRNADMRNRERLDQLSSIASTALVNLLEPSDRSKKDVEKYKAAYLFDHAWLNMLLQMSGEDVHDFYRSVERGLSLLTQASFLNSVFQQINTGIIQANEYQVTTIIAIPRGIKCPAAVADAFGNEKWIANTILSKALDGGIDRIMISLAGTPYANLPPFREGIHYPRPTILEGVDLSALNNKPAIIVNPLR